MGISCQEALELQWFASIHQLQDQSCQDKKGLQKLRVVNEDWWDGKNDPFECSDTLIPKEYYLMNNLNFTFRKSFHLAERTKHLQSHSPSQNWCCCLSWKTSNKKSISNSIFSSSFHSIFAVENLAWPLTLLGFGGLEADVLSRTLGSLILSGSWKIKIEFKKFALPKFLIITTQIEIRGSI